MLKRSDAILISIFSFLLILNITTAQAYTIQFNLILNNTNNKVYVPGVGEIASASITNTSYTSPQSHYLTSHLNNVLRAMIYYQRSPTAIVINRSGTSSHTLGITQDLTNSKTFLVFTQGDWSAVNNRIDSIEKGTFLTNIAPSFAYGLGVKYPIKLLLEYSDIDLQSTLLFQAGTYELELESNKTDSNKALIIRRIFSTP